MRKNCKVEIGTLVYEIVSLSTLLFRVAATIKKRENPEIKQKQQKQQEIE